MGAKSQRIAIAGYGVVGQATASLFQSVAIYDPPRGWDDPSIVKGCSLTFICVPTPTVSGENDLSQLYRTIDHLAPYMGDGHIVTIRSTVLPGTVRRLHGEYPRLHFASNPEFLRRHRAFLDVLQPYRVIIGADVPAVGHQLMKLYRNRLGDKTPVVLTDSVTAELIKYASNCFLAMKISFAEELHELCLKLDVQYKTVAEAMALDPRIGGGEELLREDGQRGFIDECLPKDLECFKAFVQRVGCPATLLKATEEVNRRVLLGAESAAVKPLNKRG